MINEEGRFLIPDREQERLLKSDTSECKEFVDWRLQLLRDLSRAAFPSAQHEMWRYTKPEQFELVRLLEAREEQCHIVNNLGAAARKAPPPGIIFQDSLKGADGLVKQLRTIDAALAPDAVATLQLSAVGGVHLLRIPSNTTIDEPIFLSSLVRESGVYSSLMVVEVGSGSSVSLVHDIRSDTSAFFAPRIECMLEANSRMQLVSLQMLSAASSFLGRVRFHLMRDATLHSTFIALGGQVTRFDLDCLLHQPGASATLSALYLAGGTQHADFHTNQLHLAPHCHSNLLCKGVLKEKARGVYFGFIRVAEAAQKTDAYQKSRNLLLSPEARADAIPNLEIKANDVKCSHGATVGQVQLEELFYLMSRGLTRPRAEELLVEGFLSEVLESIPWEQTRETIRAAVVEKLHGRDTVAQ